MNQNNSEPRISFSTIVLSILALALTLIPVSIVLAEDNKEDLPIADLEFKKALVQDAFRIISETTDVNIVVTAGAGEKLVTVYLKNTTVKKAIDSICRTSGLWYRFNEKTGTFIVMTTDEYREDIIVFREDIIRVFTLRFQNVTAAARIVQDIYNNRIQYSQTIDIDPFQLNTGAGIGGAGAGGGQGGLGGGFGSQSGGFGNSGGRFGSNRGSSGINRSGTRGGSNRGSFLSGGFGGGSGTGISRDERELGTSVDLSPERLRALDLARKGGSRISEEEISALVSRDKAIIYLSTNHLHNQLLVRTTDKEAMEHIAKLIKDLDKPVPQVLLEMKILDVTIGDGFRSILDLSYSGAGTANGPPTTAPRNPLSPGTAGAAPKVSLGLGNFLLAPGNTGVFQVMSNQILTRLQLLETQNKINVLATPMLLASNNTPARLFIGEERVLVTGVNSDVLATQGGGGVVTITPETETRDIGNTLLIVPSVNSDRTVTLRIQQDSSTVSPNAARVPVSGASGVQEVSVDTVDTANIQATVIARDGLTAAVGGMIRTTSSDSEERVPILSSIPVLGQLFRRDVRDYRRSELVLLITPHVFKTPEEAQENTIERVDDLVQKPNALQKYLKSKKTIPDRPDLERPRWPAMEFFKGWGDLPETATDSTHEFIALTRFAVKAMDNPDLELPEGILPVDDLSIGESSGLFQDKSVSTKIVRAWKGFGYRIYAVRLKNMTREKYQIDQKQFSGDWRAVTLEYKVLAPKGEEGDTALSYLIASDTFEVARREN
ncbi:MAG: DUF3438 family protein [Candidatus Nitronauta litoralis]|uniref:DUF3438 family protein n=1 Tax=Candidatus Nitronauta litoralis TaxID=2705533 RepID=A0A7T0BX13_9BACT|nr:MAG: DUF3438 family protein [Candidatus Nitronauta litoralis]